MTARDKDALIDQLMALVDEAKQELIDIRLRLFAVEAERNRLLQLLEGETL